MQQYQPTLTSLLESVETLQYRLLQLNSAVQDHLYSPDCDISAADLADRQRALGASINKVYTDFEMLKRAGGRTPERRRWTKAEFLEISEEMDDIVAGYKRVRRFIESVAAASSASASSSSSSLQEGEFEFE